ncbi:MAG: lipoate-protein ligase B [Lentimonas sp.]|jgi:lipoate-protein ligase B
MNSYGLKSQTKVLDWGRTRYENALERQQALVDQRIAGEISDTLVFTEHDPVYTIGRRKNASQHLLWNRPELKAEGIDVVRTNRGGDITYHGPGQIVGYAIISLDEQRDLHAYLRNLEEVVIRTLVTFDLNASRRLGKTGIWLGTRKICAIGIALRTWITYHGFALNVKPDLNHFSGIVPCGITDGSVTSLHKELGTAVDPEIVKNRLAVEFKNVFENSDCNS